MSRLSLRVIVRTWAFTLSAWGRPWGVLSRGNNQTAAEWRTKCTEHEQETRSETNTAIGGAGGAAKNGLDSDRC